MVEKFRREGSIPHACNRVYAGTTGDGCLSPETCSATTELCLHADLSASGSATHKCWRAIQLDRHQEEAERAYLGLSACGSVWLFQDK